MGRTKLKTCTMSGNKYPSTLEYFYANKNSEDGLHPYHKEFDNFRRVTNASVNQVRKLINLIN